MAAGTITMAATIMIIIMVMVMVMGTGTAMGMVTGTATDMGMATDTATATATRRPYTAFASSRSLNFWILPVEVLGRSTNTTWRGHLKWAK